MEKCKTCGSFLIQSTIIASFLPNSQAEKSSLKINDKIIEIDRIPITLYEQLTKREQVNNLVTVKIERNDMPLVFLVSDSNDFFTKQIQYQYICKDCYNKKHVKKTSSLKKFLIFLISIFSLIILILLGSLIYENINKPKLAEPQIQLQYNDVTERMKILTQNIQFAQNHLDDLQDNPENVELFNVKNNESKKYRKMYALADKLIFETALIRGYDFQQISQEKIEILSSIKAIQLGKIYFDYGEWLVPSSKYPNRTEISINNIVFDEYRFVETASGLCYLLANIPEQVFDKAFFIIDGHTDGVSSHQFNQGLSEKRALSIKQIMTSMYNIPENRIITKGYSWDKRAIPVEKKSSDFALNRRAEIRVCFFE